MRFIIEKEKKEPYILQVGDLVKADITIGVVCKDDNMFIIRHLFNSKYGFTGKHSSLRSLTESLDKLDDVQIFSKDKYELVLKKKTKNPEGEILDE